jgi:hypothetical protein
VQKLASNFLCVADEVWSLEHSGDASSKFFMEYGKKVPPDQWPAATTKQGVYCMTPQGDYLAAHFARHNREQTIALLKSALQKWDTVVAERRFRPQPIPKRANGLWNQEGVARRAGGTGASRPGLVLQVNSRDLPREDGEFAGPPEYRKAWNQQWLEFTSEEAAAFLPRGRGATSVPEALFRRMARETLIDNVRGQAATWTEAGIKKASLLTEEISSTPATQMIRFEGEFAAEEGGRTYTGKLYGQATYDRKANRFVLFELVSAGVRTGGTGSANFRMAGEGPTALGVSFMIEGQYESSNKSGN